MFTEHDIAHSQNSRSSTGLGQILSLAYSNLGTEFRMSLHQIILIVNLLMTISADRSQLYPVSGFQSRLPYSTWMIAKASLASTLGELDADSIL